MGSLTCQLFSSRLKSWTPTWSSQPHWGDATPSPWVNLCNNVRIRQLQVEVPDGAYTARAPDASVGGQEVQESDSDSDSNANVNEGTSPQPAVAATSGSQPLSSDESEGDKFTLTKSPPKTSPKKMSSARSTSKKTPPATSKKSKWLRNPFA
ncbi:hypothetical protein PC128_g18445 [Phytophthora cactorum]|nr:hypothetical protein PC128_g18445 [Phytophthora cactorum]